jgi:hypothetical protein
MNNHLVTVTLPNLLASIEQREEKRMQIEALAACMLKYDLPIDDLDDILPIVHAHL